jgi:hypothetical protein
MTDRHIEIEQQLARRDSRIDRHRHARDAQAPTRARLKKGQPKMTAIDKPTVLLLHFLEIIHAERQPEEPAVDVFEELQRRMPGLTASQLAEAARRARDYASILRKVGWARERTERKAKR